MPFIQEFGPVYVNWGKLTEATIGLGKVPVRQFEWPYKISTGLVIKLGKRGFLLGFWRKNPDLYELDEEELLLNAIDATREGYFREQAIGKAGNIEWVPFDPEKDIRTQHGGANW